MRITAVIPTLNRPRPLGELLESILSNTVVPDQIVVVDQSDSRSVRCLLDEIRPRFASCGASLEYFWRREKSLTAARNFGVAQATGDIVSFFDDDLILSPKYFETVENLFAEEPWLKGVQGYISNDPRRGRISNLVRRAFFGDHVGKESRIIPSFRARVMDPDIAKRMRVVQTDFLNGVSTYRSEVFGEFSFDEKLTKYSLGEDRDFSYRVGKRYRGALAVAVEAEVTHRHFTEARLTDRDYLFMQAAHSLYLFSKNIEQVPINRAKFWWHWLGRFLTGIAPIVKSDSASRGHARDLLDSLKFMIRHRRELVQGDLRALYAVLGEASSQREVLHE